MNRIHNCLYAVSMVLWAVLLAGCMSCASSDAAYLLEEDYQGMTDTELVSYEQELSDQLVNSSRSSGNDVGVGIGLGSWGSNVGFGIHADKWFGGGESEMSRELMQRRADVREEMRKRGLLEK